MISNTGEGLHVAYIRVADGDVLVTPETIKALSALYVSGARVTDLARSVDMGERTLRRAFADQKLDQRKRGFGSPVVHKSGPDRGRVIKRER
jgi:hypothetical protein